LYICQKIVQAHHGTLELKSTVGEGTTFFIYLPIKEVKGNY
jgi:signal transduction histidine kinase